MFERKKKNLGAQTDNMFESGYWLAVNQRKINYKNGGPLVGQLVRATKSMKWNADGTRTTNTGSRFKVSNCYDSPASKAPIGIVIKVDDNEDDNVEDKVLLVQWIQGVICGDTYKKKLGADVLALQRAAKDLSCESKNEEQSKNDALQKLNEEQSHYKGYVAKSQVSLVCNTCTVNRIFPYQLSGLTLEEGCNWCRAMCVTIKEVQYCSKNNQSTSSAVVDAAVEQAKDSSWRQLSTKGRSQLSFQFSNSHATCYYQVGNTEKHLVLYYIDDEGKLRKVI